jgi:hypothetical protein
VTDADQLTPNVQIGKQPPQRLLAFARWCAYASGIVGVIGVAFLFGLYLSLFTTGRGFGLGEINDAAIVVQYLLMLPIAVVVWQILRPHAPTASLVLLIVGVAGMLAIIVLQLLLLAHVLPFRRQIGMVSIAFLVVAVWFLINGRLGRSASRFPQGMKKHVLAASYLGYPFWAFALARRLRQ